MIDHLNVSRAKRYAVVFFRWLSVAALVFVATGAGGIYISDHLLTKIYSATAVLSVQPQPPDSESYAGWAFSTPQSEAVEAELESIESPEVLQSVVANLGLDRAGSDQPASKSDPLTQQEAVRRLKGELQLKYKHGTDIVEVCATSEDPKEAADIANAIASGYKTMRDAKAHVSAEGAGAASPVRVVERASVPETPSWPKPRFCYAVTAGAAGLLSVMIASAMEVCLLIARAEESAKKLEPVL
jgi:uncharacterized protein involved in exopolysaccharide biosynthesis